jgi:hypothetical protein
MLEGGTGYEAKLLQLVKIKRQIGDDKCLLMDAERDLTEPRNVDCGLQRRLRYYRS